MRIVANITFINIILSSYNNMVSNIRQHSMRIYFAWLIFQIIKIIVLLKIKKGANIGKTSNAVVYWLCVTTLVGTFKCQMKKAHHHNSCVRILRRKSCRVFGTVTIWSHEWTEYFVITSCSLKFRYSIKFVYEFNRLKKFNNGWAAINASAQSIFSTFSVKRIN